MTDESGGLAGGERLVDGRALCKSTGGSLSKSFTDPYWIRGGSYGWSADFDWESDDDMSSMENEEDLVDPYFLWLMCEFELLQCAPICPLYSCFVLNPLLKFVYCLSLITVYCFP
ncbi:uncharacterized protein LOC130999154 [Salvia miltiorrhiza]|uniref:uncharacterized protein LOC130999154 n=1 Tax=Salvia miltiorrhiza TaxID=226208 RepID=UPI0025AD861B|nr:uncharacterized protein LOC130999154 [Salvia miltiorrhiza]